MKVLDGMNTDMQISVARSYKHFLEYGSDKSTINRYSRF